MKNPWQTLEKEIIYENPWIKLEEHKIIDPNGNNGIYGKVFFKNKAVGIVPIDKDDCIYLVGQYRYTINEYSWEIPMGGCAINESPIDAAIRELKEETGLIAREFDEIMRVHTSNSITDEEGIIFLAKNLTQSTRELDPTEKIDVKRVSFDEAVELVINGKITDAISCNAILKIALLRSRIMK